ncbi:hypothetical protein ACFFJB_02705 [Camelimonas abortus]|uniref:Cobalamin biosynthesis protein n=1 Tax=Camelimonas abortus TaxID=1017184 RepID=A0ABV7LDM5_9HYPH
MRAMMRFLGFLAAVGGFIALVLDMTRYLANGAWTFCTLADALNGVAPGAAAAFAAFAGGHGGPWAGAAAERALACPAAAAGLAGGFLIMFLFRRREAAPG